MLETNDEEPSPCRRRRICDRYGAAFADGNGYAPQAEAIHAAAVADPVHRVFATTSHSEVWIYPAFRSEGYAQGGES